MAKAAICVTACDWEPTAEQMVLSYTVVTDTGIAVSTMTPTNLVAAAAQVAADIKAAARQLVIDVGGPSIADVDMTVFGEANLPETLSDTTAPPALEERGSVNVGQPQRTSRMARGLSVWRRTVAGYLPAQNRYVNKINGAPNALIFSVDGAEGMVLDYALHVVPTATLAQFHKFRFPDDSERSVIGPVVAPRLSIFGKNRLFVLLRNNWPTAALDGRTFVLTVDYIDPGNPR